MNFPQRQTALYCDLCVCISHFKTGGMINSLFLNRPCSTDHHSSSECRLILCYKYIYISKAYILVLDVEPLCLYTVLSYFTDPLFHCCQSQPSKGLTTASQLQKVNDGKRNREDGRLERKLQLICLMAHLCCLDQE